MKVVLDTNVLVSALIKAGNIVSGDKHLLALKEFKGVKILTIDEMISVTKC